MRLMVLVAAALLACGVKAPPRPPLPEGADAGTNPTADADATANPNSTANSTTTPTGSPRTP